jgi:DNA gyrase/topoisomerase IV subunit B
MDILTQSLLNLSNQDARIAKSVFSMLIGEDVPIHRIFIEDNTLNVSYIDA